MEEAENLLGAYIGMVKLMRRFNKADLQRSIEQNRLAYYITYMYDQHGQDSYYSKWFRDNFARFA